MNDAKTWIRDQDASFELNEPDAYALEEALRLKEKHGGEVVVLSAGPARVDAGDSRGAGARRRSRHSRRRRRLAAPMHSSSPTRSRRRSARRQVDLVLTGLQSDDQGFAQVGVILAENSACRTRRSSWKYRVERQQRAAREARARRRLVPVDRACRCRRVLTIQSGINQLRYATFKGIMAAKKKEIRSRGTAAA